MLEHSQNQTLVAEGDFALVFDRSFAVLDRAEDRGIILLDLGPKLRLGTSLSSELSTGPEILYAPADTTAPLFKSRYQWHAVHR